MQILDASRPARGRARVQDRYFGCRCASWLRDLARDGHAVPPAVYLCECKFWTRPVPQEVVHAFRTVISDAGAHRGFVISHEMAMRYLPPYISVNANSGRVPSRKRSCTRSGPLFRMPVRIVASSSRM